MSTSLSQMILVLFYYILASTTFYHLWLKHKNSKQNILPFLTLIIFILQIMCVIEIQHTIAHINNGYENENCSQ